MKQRRFSRRLAAGLAAAFIAGQAHAEYRILPDKSVARNWSEALIEALRHDAGQVAVNARNVFHFTIAVYDAWAVHDQDARPYLLGQAVNGFGCPYDHSADRIGSVQAQETAISYAAYRFLRHRYKDSAGSLTSYAIFDSLMAHYGLDPEYSSTDYVAENSAAALGTYIASCLIGFGLADGSNESDGYRAAHYQPVNPARSASDQ